MLLSQWQSCWWPGFCLTRVPPAMALAIWFLTKYLCLGLKYLIFNMWASAIFFCVQVFMLLACVCGKKSITSLQGFRTTRRWENPPTYITIYNKHASNGIMNLTSYYRLSTFRPSNTHTHTYIYIYIREWTALSLVHLVAFRLLGAKLLTAQMLNHCQYDRWEQA